MQLCKHNTNKLDYAQFITFNYTIAMNESIKYLPHDITVLEVSSLNKVLLNSLPFTIWYFEMKPKNTYGSA